MQLIDADTLPATLADLLTAADGLKVMTVADAAKWADLMMMVTPDELQADIWRDEIAPNIRDGAAMVWAQRAGLTVGLLSARSSGARSSASTSRASGAVSTVRARSSP